MISIKNSLLNAIRSVASDKHLVVMPIFSDEEAGYLTSDLLHKSYYPDVSVSNLILNVRAEEVLKKAKIKTIGKLLLTPYSELLLHRNCGFQTITVFQNELQRYILQKKSNFSEKWIDFESMLRSVLKIKERNLLIFFHRIGLNSTETMTLQECGRKFCITREAVRQINNQIHDLILHPETELLLRPFWLTIDKHLDKKKIATSKELAKKIQERFEWKEKPDSHCIESILKIKKDRYEVTANNLISHANNGCINCNELFSYLPKVMASHPEYPYHKVYQAFLEHFELTCENYHQFSKTIVEQLVKLQLQKLLNSSDNSYKLKGYKIVDTSIRNKRRRRT